MVSEEKVKILSQKKTPWYKMSSFQPKTNRYVKEQKNDSYFGKEKSD